MLYIFDLGNVIVDIDFKRVLGVWSDYSRVPLASLQSKFTIGEPFHLHERGQISDEQFAQRLGHDLGMALSYEQFSAGWQAIFVGLRKETIAVMQALRDKGHRVVVLSNTNQLHCEFWPGEYPEVAQVADKIYLSQQMGMRKPDAEIYLTLLEEEGFSANEAVFFDDNEDNINSARQLGITAILVTGKETVPDWFAENKC